MRRELVVTSSPKETRVALLEDSQVAEFFIERSEHASTAGNIYKGRVSRVLPGMGSAFVDIGLERDAFMHAEDVFEDLPENLLEEEERGAKAAPIEDLVSPGQDIVVQVVKESLGTKGARITAHISLPGRFMVFLPTVEHVGVSRRVQDDDERKRLKSFLKGIRRENGGGGFIGRTAALGREVVDLERDARNLIRTWDEVRGVASRGKAPMLLYKEPSLVERLLRDLLGKDVAGVHVDDPELHKKVYNFLDRVDPELLSKVRLVNRPGHIFDDFGINAELEGALKARVPLESGGSIVIEETEALVSVDVNTGRFVGKSDHEETIVKNNIEAAREIARQLRLRDLGGIIVLDFIDMKDRKNRKKVLAVLDGELRRDRATSRVLSVSEFGLVILTRKRVRESLSKTLCETCPECGGAGRVKSVPTILTEIYDEIRKLPAELKTQKLTLRAAPAVADVLLEERDSGFLSSISSLLSEPLGVEADPLLSQEQFDILTGPPTV